MTVNKYGKATVCLHTRQPTQWDALFGVTSDLVKRVHEHKNNLVDGFTQKYGVHTLVWFEPHETMESAITREKQIKKWNRDWKLQLIEESNSAWRDIYEDIV